MARKETDATKKDPVWDASCDKISNQNVYSYHFSQNRVLFPLSRPISTMCVLSPWSSFFSGRMLYGYPDSQHRPQQKCVLHLEITMEDWLSHPFCTSFLTRRILWCAFAASPPLPRAFPSHPCLFLVVFLTSYHGVFTNLIMIIILLFCYLSSYLAILISYFACS